MCDQTTEQVEIIGFQDEGRKEELNAPIQNTSIPSSLIQASTKEDRNHTIPGFLQRAYQIDNFNWTINDMPGKVLKQYRFPDILLKQPALNKKAWNFFGLRAGVELIVLVNKQQFQQGNLMISFLPGARYNGAKDRMCQTTTPSASDVNLTTLSGMPRTNLDLMDATRADLSVPYASPYIYYNLLTKDGTIGDFYITVYSKLQDVATNGYVSVQVMARFIDVDLQFPAGNDLPSFSETPQFDNLFYKFAKQPDVSTLQALLEEGKSVVKKVQDGNFRFQMNSENLTTSNFKPKALPNMAVATESNNAHLLSLSSNTYLPSANMGEASLSEMSFSKIVQIPVFNSRFDIKASDPAGKNVWSKPVTLLDFTNTAPDKKSYGVDYITFLGQNFSKWRTSFKYHFRFIKTTFHSLRVRIFFAPNSSKVEGIDRNAVISKIVDLKDNNYVEFEVPFIWPHPFLNTDEKYSHSLGIIGVDVLTQMVRPDTVKDTIDVIVERSAGTDFCLNLPKQLTYYPFDTQPLTFLVKEKRKKEGVDTVDGWVRDLTREGVESNPGPVRSLYFPVTTTVVKKSIPSVGKQGDIVRVLVTVCGYGDFPPEVYTRLDFGDNDVLLIACNYDKAVEFMYQLKGPDLEFSVDGKATKLGCCVNVFSGVQAAATNVNVANLPLDVQIQNSSLDVLVKNSSTQPVPVIGGGGGGTSSVVATRSDTATTGFRFQMNAEQDNYRPGYDETSYVRPVNSVQADQLSLGTQVTSVNQMINRSSAFNSLETKNMNDIYVIPHAFGIARADANNDYEYGNIDLLSYYSSLYAFARGGVNLRIASSPDYFYNVILDPDASSLAESDSENLGQLASATSLTRMYQQHSSIQQVVKPSLEGFGEITIPFYSDTYMYYVNPSVSSKPSKESQTMQLPFTTMIIRPSGVYSQFQVFRAACKDFEFSYLTGPPRMVAIA